MTTLGRHNPKSGVSSSWQSSQLGKQFPRTKFSKNDFSTKNVFHAIKTVFAREKSFLRWVDKTYFHPWATWAVPPGGHFPKIAVSPTLPFLRLCRIFRTFVHFPQLFATFPPLKPFGAHFFAGPFPADPCQIPGPDPARRAQLFVCCDCYLTRTGKKGHRSIQKCDPRPTSIRSSEPLAPGGGVPRARAQKVPFCLYFWPRG